MSTAHFLGQHLSVRARYKATSEDGFIVRGSDPTKVLGHGGDKKKRRELREAAKAAESERRRKEREDNPAKFYEDISEAEVERLSKLVYWPGVNQP